MNLALTHQRLRAQQRLGNRARHQAFMALCHGLNAVPEHVMSRKVMGELFQVAFHCGQPKEA
jgi:hypothetical protein